MKTIKNILQIVFVLLLFNSCDPGITTEHYIDNKTNDTITCDFYRGNSIYKKVTVPGHEVNLFYTYLGTGSPSHAVLAIGSDSIEIYGFKDTVVTMYWGDLSNNSMYDQKNWIEGDNDGVYTLTYVFE